MKPQWIALHRAVNHLVRSYRTDLDHDCNAIEACDYPFLHWTRDSGTSMEFLPPPDSDAFPPAGVEVPYLFGHATREHMANQLVEYAKFWTQNTHLACHYWNGRELTQITPQRAWEIADAHRRHLHATWGEAQRTRLRRLAWSERLLAAA
jgi:hypothetical protein